MVPLVFCSYPNLDESAYGLFQLEGISPSLLVPYSVNQRLPSGPTAISRGTLPLGKPYSVIAPAVVIFPILLVPSSANHRFPSGPFVMPPGCASFGSVYSVIVP